MVFYHYFNFKVYQTIDSRKIHFLKNEYGDKLTNGAFSCNVHGVSRTTQWNLVVAVDWFPNVAHADWTHWTERETSTGIGKGVQLLDDGSLALQCLDTGEKIIKIINYFMEMVVFRFTDNYVFVPLNIYFWELDNHNSCFVLFL